LVRVRVFKSLPTNSRSLYAQCPKNNKQKENLAHGKQQVSCQCPLYPTNKQEQKPLTAWIGYLIFSCPIYKAQLRFWHKFWKFSLTQYTKFCNIK
jgi:hypothetical protein